MEKDPKGAYVRDVTARTRDYLRELREENERLRGALVVSESERTRLTSEISDLRRQLDTYTHSPLGLDKDQLAQLAEENRRYAERYVVLEQKNAHLANLYVASYRLHETLSRDEVLGIIQEIIINLVGCEHHAIFDVSRDGTTLELLASMGINAALTEHVRIGDEVAARALMAGEVFVPESGAESVSGHPEPLTALVPLRLAGETTGAIAVYRLLPQKQRIEDIDRELFELLAIHAGMALYCTKLHQSRAAR